MEWCYVMPLWLFQPCWSGEANHFAIDRDEAWRRKPNAMVLVVKNVCQCIDWSWAMSASYAHIVPVIGDLGFLSWVDRKRKQDARNGRTSNFLISKTGMPGCTWPTRGLLPHDAVEEALVMGSLAAPASAFTWVGQVHRHLHCNNGLVGILFESAWTFLPGRKPL